MILHALIVVSQTCGIKIAAQSIESIHSTVHQLISNFVSCLVQFQDIQKVFPFIVQLFITNTASVQFVASHFIVCLIQTITVEPSIVPFQSIVSSHHLFTAIK
ncbi:hypothetical protein IJU97_04895 [bacterium]|nr:hypothetical protein [bacterium]